jgi:hypothetical protein
MATIAIVKILIDYDSVVLTRYLYNKTKVLDNLEQSILLKNEEEAYFWAYEIYFSGLEDEVFVKFFDILKKYYSYYPRLYKYLFQIYTKWKDEYSKLNLDKKSDDVDMIIAVFIENIMLRNPLVKEPKKQFYLSVPFDIEFINLYKTKNIIPSRKTLETVCKYSLINSNCTNKTPIKSAFIGNIGESYRVLKKCQGLKEPLENKEYFYHIIENWLYYASRSPIWRERIYNYGGKIVDEEENVIFDNDEKLEEFYDNYGFELDEQTLDIQRRCIGI